MRGDVAGYDLQELPSVLEKAVGRSSHKTAGPRCTKEAAQEDPQRDRGFKPVKTTSVGRKRKYGNKKIHDLKSGQVFDSKKEYSRWKELVLLEQAGEITNLHRQVPFVLIPEQRLPGTETYKRGPRKGQTKPGPVIERKLTYIADFMYEKAGKVVVEDSKGLRTKEYIIKRKLMLYKYGIRIKET